MRCAAHLQEFWKDKWLRLNVGGVAAYGYAEYGKVLEDHDREQQRTQTLTHSPHHAHAAATYREPSTAHKTQLGGYLYDFGFTITLSLYVEL